MRVGLRPGVSWCGSRWAVLAWEVVPETWVRSLRLLPRLWGGERPPQFHGGWKGPSEHRRPATEPAASSELWRSRTGLVPGERTRAWQRWAGRRPHAPGPGQAEAGPEDAFSPASRGRRGWRRRGLGGWVAPHGRCVSGPGVNFSQLRELPALPGGAAMWWQERPLRSPLRGLEFQPVGRLRRGSRLMHRICDSLGSRMEGSGRAWSALVGVSGEESAQPEGLLSVTSSLDGGEAPTAGPGPDVWGAEGAGPGWGGGEPGGCESSQAAAPAVGVPCACPAGRVLGRRDHVKTQPRAISVPPPLLCQPPSFLVKF